MGRSNRAYRFECDRGPNGEKYWRMGRPKVIKAKTKKLNIILSKSCDK